MTPWKPVGCSWLGSSFPPAFSSSRVVFSSPAPEYSLSTTTVAWPSSAASRLTNQLTRNLTVRRNAWSKHKRSWQPRAPSWDTPRGHKVTPFRTLAWPSTFGHKQQPYYKTKSAFLYIQIKPSLRVGIHLHTSLQTQTRLRFPVLENRIRSWRQRCHIRLRVSSK